MKKVKLSSIESCYDEIETKFINMLYNYDCLSDLGKDSHICLTKILVKHMLTKINKSELQMSIDKNGYSINVIPDRNRPYVLFYFDKQKWNNTKEILEYNSPEEFIRFFEKTVQAANYITNHRILTLEFPYKHFSEIEIEEEEASDNRIMLLKTELFEQKYSRKTIPIKDIKNRCKLYSISLTKVQEEKVVL